MTTTTDMTTPDISERTAGDPEQGDRTSLSLEYDLSHPPEKVWRALTDPALLAEWLLPVVGFRPEPGTAFMFRTQAYPGWDGTVHGEVLEVEPHRTLRYAWHVPFAGAPLDTVVAFTLAPTPSGTRLTIVQSGFAPGQQRALGGARYGWTLMAGKLTTLLARTS
ncbi:activator of HSP90 ATPase [Gemmatimonadetes bacterium T265]|nr:activator of HSP90 ATPase [Gemmatimonadetes bacterium T265]GJG89759.1 activator of HSP90 ATPase [Gemmatimonadetes bacterium T265]